ncbi:MAG: acyl-CoA-binding protein [Cytophagales bacterium]
MTFLEATEKAKQLPAQSNENLLKLYSLFKQATEGDAEDGKLFNPFDFVNKAKHEAWFSLKGMTKEDAEKNYIQLVNQLMS